MSQEQAVSAPRTLVQFAYQVAGPRESVINFIINTTIAWVLFRGQEAVPLVGGRSILMMLAPMMFLMSSLTTFFGYFNGVQARRSGAVTPPLDGNVAWRPPAIRSGLRCGAGALGICLALVLPLDGALGGPVLPGWVVILGLGRWSAVASYFLHARGAGRAGRF